MMYICPNWFAIVAMEPKLSHVLRISSKPDTGQEIPE